MGENNPDESHSRVETIEQAGNLLQYAIERAEGIVKAEVLQQKAREIAERILDAAMIAPSPVGAIICPAGEIPFDENGNCTSCGEHDPEPGWCCLKCGEYIPNLEERNGND